MKHILIFLALFSVLHAADVSLNDNGTITKGGVSLNNASDALLNQQVTAAEFQAALRSKLNDASAAVAAAQTAQQRAEARLKILVDGAKEALSLPTSEQRLAAGNALLAKVQATQSEEEKAALQAQQAEIAAKIAALEAAAGN